MQSLRKDKLQCAHSFGPPRHVQMIRTHRGQHTRSMCVCVCVLCCQGVTTEPRMCIMCESIECVRRRSYIMSLRHSTYILGPRTLESIIQYSIVHTLLQLMIRVLLDPPNDQRRKKTCSTYRTHARLPLFCSICSERHGSDSLPLYQWPPQPAAVTRKDVSVRKQAVFIFD